MINDDEIEIIQVICLYIWARLLEGLIAFPCG